MNIVISTIGTLRNPKESARITTILLAKELISQGHTVTIITPRSKQDNLEEIIEGVQVYHPCYVPFFNSILGPAFSIRKLRQKESIDIIHSFSATPLFVLSSWLGKVGSSVKMVHTLKSYSRTTWGNRGYFLTNLAQKVTIPTIEFKKRLHLVRKDKISIIHSPIDTTKFQPKLKSKLRQKYGYGSEKIILYYGALWKQKGIDDLIEAMPKILQTIPNAKLIIAPRYAQIKPQQERVQQLNIQNQVSFLVDIPIEEYVALADVVVLPYQNLDGTEGNPSCMLEAMASKTMMVTTDLPELREIGAGCVLFAKASDPKSLAETISTALTMNKKEANVLLQKAYEKSTEFDSKRIAQTFLGLYQNTLKQ